MSKIEKYQVFSELFENYPHKIRENLRDRTKKKDRPPNVPKVASDGDLGLGDCENWLDATLENPRILVFSGTVFHFRRNSPGGIAKSAKFSSMRFTSIFVG